MTAIDPKETARYAARLFGYFLAVAIVGGGITAGGAVLLRNEDVFSSGSIDASAEVIVGGALAGVGILLVLAGLLAIVLNVVADGVRFGLEGTTTEPESEPARTPAPAWTPGERRRTAGPAPRRRPPARNRDRERTRVAGGDESTDDETWKREVEEKLADEDRPGRTEGPVERPPSTAAGPTDRDRSADVSSSTEGSPGSRAETPDGTGTDRAATRESGVERDPEGERQTDPTDAGTGTHVREPTASSEAERSNSAAWVSGEEVNGEESTEAGEGVPSETGADDDPLAPGSADEPEPTDTADGDSDDDSESPAWLEESGDDHEER